MPFDFDDEGEKQFEVQTLFSDSPEDIANLMTWAHSVLRPWEKPRQSVDVPKPEDMSVLARRERSRKESK